MSKYPIEQVLPHSHPMILIDQLIDNSETSAECSVQIGEHSNFYNTKRQSVPSYVGIEYMAQTIAAYANALKLEQGDTVSLGFLVSSRSYTAQISEFSLGSKLSIYVERILKEANGLSVFNCKIEHENQEVVQATINVFEPDDPELYLQEQQEK